MARARSTSAGSGSRPRLPYCFRTGGLYGIRTPAEPVTNPSPDLLKKGQAACGTSGGTQVPAEIVTAPGDTGPYNSGDLAGAVQVFFFVLAIGAFITVTIKTGALDAGIGRVTH